jgi:hypothetical protein
MTLRRFALLSLLVVGTALAASGPAAAQCAMCKTVLTQSAEGRAMTDSLNRAILLMIAAPYAVFAVVGAALFRDQIRRWALRRFAR